MLQNCAHLHSTYSSWKGIWNILSPWFVLIENKTNNKKKNEKKNEKKKKKKQTDYI